MRIGDPASFAIAWEWEDAPEVVDPTQRCTWARIELFCAGHSLLRHEGPDGQVYDDVHMAASSLANWMAQHWAGRFAAERVYGAARARDGHDLLQKLTDQELDLHGPEIERWLRATSLASVGDGWVLPTVIFWRRGPQVIVSWRSDDEADSGFRYLSEGSVSVRLAAIRDVFLQFTSEVAGRIEASLIDGALDPVAQACRGLLRPAEEQREVLAARLGLRDDFEAWDWSAWFDPSSGRPEDADSALASAARSASPNFGLADLARLGNLGETLRVMAPAAKLAELRAEVWTGASTFIGAMRDWELGYARAGQVRAALWQVEGPLDIEALLAALGVRVLSVSLDDRETDGLALWDATAGTALVATNERSVRAATSWGKRATLAHELYHLLFDTRDSRFFGELTSDWSATPSERVANAFAAELLLPKAALPSASELWPHLVPKVKDLCERYQVGWELAVWQLRNRAGLPEAEAQVLLARPPQARP